MLEEREGIKPLRMRIVKGTDARLKGDEIFSQEATCLAVLAHDVSLGKR